MTIYYRKFKNEGMSLFSCIKKGNEQFYMSIFLFYVCLSILFEIGWKPEVIDYVWKVNYFIFTTVMWSVAIYIFMILVEWRNDWSKTWAIILIGLLIFVITAVVSRFVTTDSYKFVIGLFVCLMAYGKKYKHILQCSICVILATVILGYVLMICGITYDAAKPERTYGGHSLGIIYPNNWGYLVFVIMILVWYLYLRNKKIPSTLMFWAAAVFMYKYITCLTIAAMAFLFPVAGIIAEILQDRHKKRSTSDKEDNNPKWLSGLIIVLPFIFLAVMLILCWQMDWVHETFYGTRLESFAMRFVEGGYALRLGGVKLFGRPFSQMQEGVISYLKDIDMKIDSAYITYLIIRGIIPITMTLGWIAYVHKVCLKNRDFRLLIISVFMLIFSMMERPGLDAWYNFTLLYPLASKDTLFY